jgi:hypothetical protein
MRGSPLQCGPAASTTNLSFGVQETNLLGERLGGLDPDRGRIDDLDLGDRLEEGGVAVLDAGVDVAGKAELDGVGVERLAVVELDALAELELPGGVVDDLPAQGEARLDLQIEVAVDQPIEDRPDHAF